MTGPRPPTYSLPIDEILAQHRRGISVGTIAHRRHMKVEEVRDILRANGIFVTIAKPRSPDSVWDIDDDDERREQIRKRSARAARRRLAEIGAGR